MFVDFVVDDVDPSTEGLDNIADGQLYRIRRGISSTNHLRGTQSGRGRSASVAGGHMTRGQSSARGRVLISG
jgi:hypothetical protein